MSYTDWIGLVKKTVENTNELSILEFGLGDGTEYLLDNFRFVYSHELIDEPVWYNKIVSRFSNRKNWEHKLVLFKDIYFKGVNPDAGKPWYENDEVILYQLYKDIDELFKKYTFDAVLIDGEYFVRGYIANYILNKYMPLYMIIHDVNYLWVKDNYDKIQMPELYSTERLNTGQGSMIFIKNYQQ